ncbi:GIY-YIG nuclease family protein [Patescibacteria group bacterium]|nr:MAG: GIY-YIG nuclease family protein [Patescibacteria group bacterium]
MANDRQYFVYILTNVTNRVLYTGITNNLVRRVYEHRQKVVKGFTAKYNVNKLVYFEASAGAYEAITREKQIKGWVRRKKIALIDSMNPIWADVSGNLY